jgi:hypothetical protein
MLVVFFLRRQAKPQMQPQRFTIVFKRTSFITVAKSQYKITPILVGRKSRHIMTCGGNSRPKARLVVPKLVLIEIQDSRVLRHVVW